MIGQVITGRDLVKHSAHRLRRGALVRGPRRGGTRGAVRPIAGFDFSLIHCLQFWRAQAWLRIISTAARTTRAGTLLEIRTLPILWGRTKWTAPATVFLSDERWPRTSSTAQLTGGKGPNIRTDWQIWPAVSVRQKPASRAMVATA